MINKKYVAILVILLFVVIGAASGYLLLSSSKTPVNTAHHNITGSDSSGLYQVNVTIENGTFNPSNLTVKPDTTVTWVVKDDSDTKYMVTGTGFMSPHLGNGQSWSCTFKETGTHNYYDMDHMDDKKLTGTIVVQ